MKSMSIQLDIYFKTGLLEVRKKCEKVTTIDHMGKVLSFIRI